MYKFDKNHQFSLADFNQPMGLKNESGKPLGKES